MATTTKTTTKKTAQAKKNVATSKAVATKKPVAKKATTKKVSAKPTPAFRSFRISPNTPSFTTFKVTRQTVYWIIIVAFIAFMQLWILKMQIETSNYIETELSALQSES